MEFRFSKYCFLTVQAVLADAGHKTRVVEVAATPPKRADPGPHNLAAQALDPARAIRRENAATLPVEAKRSDSISRNQALDARDPDLLHLLALAFYATRCIRGGLGCRHGTGRRLRMSLGRVEAPMEGTAGCITWRQIELTAPSGHFYKVTAMHWVNAVFALILKAALPGLLLTRPFREARRLLTVTYMKEQRRYSLKISHDKWVHVSFEHDPMHECTAWVLQACHVVRALT